MELMDVGVVRQGSQGLCGLARAAGQRGPTFDQAKSKTPKVLGYLKKQLKKKKKLVVVHPSSAGRPLAASISQPGGGSLSENEALAERD